MVTKITDLLLLILAVTVIYARYEAVKIPAPKSDIVTVISGHISSVPRSQGDLQSFKVGQISVTTRRPPEYAYGDYLTIEGTLTPHLQMWYPRVQKTDSREQKRDLIGFQKNLLDFRQTLVSQITAAVPTPEAELISGVLWGAASNLPPEFNNALKRTGTIHMVVVSGYNISVICALLLTSFSVLGRRLSALVTVLGILVFTLLTGAEAPSVRAAIMGGLVVVGQLIGRERTALRLLVISAGVMLVVNPLWVTDLGFQLSFLATLGILLFGAGNSVETSHATSKSSEQQQSNSLSSVFNKLETQHVASLPFYNELLTTLAAQVLTWPLIASAFGTVSLISPVANVLTGWTVPLMMAGGALLTCVSPLSTTLAQLISLVLLVPATFFVQVVMGLSKVPGAVAEIEFGSEMVAVYYLIVGLWWLFRDRVTGSSGPLRQSSSEASQARG